MDDENSNVVTAGAIVTVTVTLSRKNMKELFGDSTIAEKQSIRDEDVPLVQEQNSIDANDETIQNQIKKPVWLKQNKKNHKSKAKAKSPPAKSKIISTKVIEDKKSKEKSNTELGSDNESQESDNEDVQLSGSDDEDERKNKGGNGDDDVEWEKFQQKINKREKLEGKSKLSHSVHCPLFPEDKQEYWWTYICDRKSKTMLTAPFHVTNLIEHEEIQLKFTAPRWPGIYVFTVCLRSDSYIGLDQQQDLKLDVKEAAAIPTDHPQWELSESESEPNEQQGNESEFTTDPSDGEDD